MNSQIPLFKVHNPPRLLPKISKILKSGYIAEGIAVERFKEKICKIIKNKKVVLFNSCTSALVAAYDLAGIKKDSEVISTPLTCVAANVPLLKIGAKIVWCDVDYDTGMMSLEHLKKIITRKTKAIVVLHKDGEPFDIQKLKKIIKDKKSKAKIIEDAAHAFGAKINGKMIGNHGDFIAFSFQAIKQIHTIDGGALVCKNKKDYLVAKKMKWLGIDRDKRNNKKNIWENDIDTIGYKANMTNIPACIGIEQLNYLNKILKKHNENGKYLDKHLKKISHVNVLKRNQLNFSTYWVYSFTSDKKRKIVRELNKNNIISIQVHPRNDEYSIFKKFKKNLPNLNRFQKNEINIPCGWWVSKRSLDKIIKIIRKTNE